MEKIFWEYCKEKKLMLQKCNNCGKVIWPYTISCPECLSFDIDYIQAEGKGKIFSYTIFYIPFHKEFKDKIPYVVAIIELSEGVKFMSNIVTDDFSLLECGKDVELIWEKFEDKFIPIFKLC